MVVGLGREVAEGANALLRLLLRRGRRLLLLLLLMLLGLLLLLALSTLTVAHIAIEGAIHAGGEGEKKVGMWIGACGEHPRSSEWERRGGRKRSRRFPAAAAAGGVSAQRRRVGSRDQPRPAAKEEKGELEESPRLRDAVASCRPENLNLNQNSALRTRTAPARTPARCFGC